MSAKLIEENMKWEHVTKTTLTNIVKEMNTKQSCGHVEILMKVIKDVIELLA